MWFYLLQTCYIFFFCATFDFNNRNQQSKPKHVRPLEYSKISYEHIHTVKCLTHRLLHISSHLWLKCSLFEKQKYILLYNKHLKAGSIKFVYMNITYVVYYTHNINKVKHYYQQCLSR